MIQILSHLLCFWRKPLSPTQGASFLLCSDQVSFLKTWILALPFSLFSSSNSIGKPTLISIPNTAMAGENLVTGSVGVGFLYWDPAPVEPTPAVQNFSSLLDSDGLPHLFAQGIPVVAHYSHLEHGELFLLEMILPVFEHVPQSCSWGPPSAPWTMLLLV